ncbi:MAG: 16S rRNA (cytosine(1402)-N(4))-methyltransferase RsmH [Armatimonadetes bacterium]|nr:16S rRNA (cytosine(1402)-N(4))-methyltransferase RsmH [Armatimonadota bacterium]MDE2205211.1 16S rRNA (cytosine(1402)-N(4))-methyltransferase RsmH [Armatimonadota bacterium]
MPRHHVPVLPGEAMDLLGLQPGGAALDATVGDGGHARLMWDAIGRQGRFVGIDVDKMVSEAISTEMRQHVANADMLTGNFGDLESLVLGLRDGATLRFDAVLFDLGWRVGQLESVPGLSLSGADSPLDMRLAGENGAESAAELLATMPEDEISEMLASNSDERFAGPIAAAIVRQRRAGAPITTAGDLCRLVMEAVPRRAWPKRTHVATKTFSALRILVNRELEMLRRGVLAAAQRLASGGTLVVIAFHGTEDRIVKQLFREMSGVTSGTQTAAAFRLLTPHVVHPLREETLRNRRSRSARLRAIRRRPMMGEENPGCHPQ